MDGNSPSHESQCHTRNTVHGFTDLPHFYACSFSKKDSNAAKQ